LRHEQRASTSNWLQVATPPGIFASCVGTLRREMARGNSRKIGRRDYLSAR
jgi:hypothetical protein